MASTATAERFYPEGNYIPSFYSWQDRAEKKSRNITCGWEPLRAQLLLQWAHISAAEVDSAGPNHSRLAALLQRKCGIDAILAENYLRNFERTMPLG